MASLLFRLGRSAFRLRWVVALLWVAVIAAIGFGAVNAPAAGDPQLSVPGIESQKAFDLINQRFPGADAKGAGARVVFVAPDGQKVTAAKYRTVIDKTVAAAARSPQVASAADPFKTHAVSKDGSTAYATISYKVKSGDLTGATKKTLTGALRGARASGLTVEAGGTAVSSQAGIGGSSEVIGIVLAAVILLVTFGSLAAAGMPLISAIVGVGVSTLAVLALSSTFGLTSATSSLASMLGLACGIDYALFIVSRYREERARGREAREAAATAVGTAGSAVVVAGLTVIIALAGLSVVGIPMLASMGIAAAAAVAVAVLVAVTLVPALLGFWPDAVLPRKARRARKARASRNGGRHAGQAPADTVRDSGVRESRGGRWPRFVLRHPILVVIAAVVGLGILAVPAAGLHLGTSGDGAKPVSTTERRAYDALSKGFGAGFNGPLTVVVDARETGAHTPDAPPRAVQAIESRLAPTSGVASVSAPRFNTAGDTAILTVMPATGPTDARTADLVHAIRAERPALERQTGATYQVTGSTASDIDMAQKIQGALLPYLAVVLGLAIVLLLVIFRSIVVPFKAAAGFLLSVLAALGSVVAVFQWGWGAGLLGLGQGGPIMSLMPIFLVGIVFGLAMDYEVFLVSRMREAFVHDGRADRAIVAGFGLSARVVAAVALIMISVFSGFVGAGEPMIKMIGFGLAVAVLFDAFVVRMAFVPAVLALFGKAAWWIPRWLDRVLPRLDVEGASLTGAFPPPAARKDSRSEPASVG
ncbi:MAG TPA: MMPL family transporter [Spirillospora sp.]|nr:MMPL family transporter [Spirillospora sp.]